MIRELSSEPVREAVGAFQGAMPPGRGRQPLTSAKDEQRMRVALALIFVAVGSVVFHFLSPWWWTPIASNWGYVDDTIRRNRGAVDFDLSQNQRENAVDMCAPAESCGPFDRRRGTTF
jgi:hypothetical protein